MIATDNKKPEYPSDLADFRRVPLVDMPAVSEDLLDSALQRLVPAPLTGQVPVAAFNSSI